MDIAYKMPCTSPLTAYSVPSAKPNGKKTLAFSYQPNSEPMQLRCGQCTACRLERSRQWAARCYHESTLHKDNCFLTLTYSDEHLPADHSLHKRHYQLFLKKLRKRHPDRKIRYFLCGEYGEINRRPHYHICLFNFDFKDKKQYKTAGQNVLYMSRELDELWNKGLSTIGELNFATAAYTARYVMKKVTGAQAEDHYIYIDETGKEHRLEPEFVAMSRKPGIAHDWYKKYKNDLYPSDTLVINGKESLPTKYYDSLHETLHPEQMETIKEKRIEKMQSKPVEEYLDKRLLVKNNVLNARQKLYSRRSL